MPAGTEIHNETILGRSLHVVWIMARRTTAENLLLTNPPFALSRFYVSM
jgi:hypothetical protein